MFSRSKMILLGVLTIMLFAFIVGCDQPADVITPNGRAYLTLTPERFPNNPVGTEYQLWVANDSDTLSLGRFAYNGEFLTTSGSVRAEKGRFFLDESIDNYNKIFISVEPEIDALPNSPASIMLMDMTSSQTIKLILPFNDSLWSSTARYNMKSTSDGIGNTNDGKSIWFASFTQNVITVTDTLSIVDWFLDSGQLVTDFIIDTITLGINNFTTFDTIQVLGADNNGVGLDTIVRTITRFNVIDSIVGFAVIDSIVYDSTVIDSIVVDTFLAPNAYYPTSLKITYADSSYSVTEEKFTQDNFELPNLQSLGWKYRGWVVSDVIDPAAVGNITLPAWSFFDPILTNVSGGLLTTGTFYEITAPDLDNPFIDTVFKNPPRVPLFPGEDFLLNLPAPLTTIPNLAGTAGHIFITLEPEFYNDTTNFPLLAFIGGLPSSGSESSTTQGYTLGGYMFTNDPFRGFPKVGVVVEKL